tara:strand:- start:86 stop:490 length:405 start_codon:yes stop_codon:yes gene_type:complete
MDTYKIRKTMTIDELTELVGLEWVDYIDEITQWDNTDASQRVHIQTAVIKSFAEKLGLQTDITICDAETLIFIENATTMWTVNVTDGAVGWFKEIYIAGRGLTKTSSCESNIDGYQLLIESIDTTLAHQAANAG